MHKELEAVFSEHAAPSHASTRDVHDAFAPIVAVVNRARHQLLEYEAVLHQAELAPHDVALDSKLEMMHQTIRRAKGDVESLLAGARAVAQCFAQLDRYMAEWQQDIAHYEAIQATAAEKAAELAAAQGQPPLPPPESAP